MSDISDASPKNPNGEPRAFRSAMPVWLVLLLALLVYRGGLMVDQAGGFQANVYPPYREAPPKTDELDGRIKRGREIYHTYCVGCHQPNGLGAIGQCPPLAKSEWVEAEGVNRIARIILVGAGGPISVRGRVYDSVSMPPFKDYIRTEEDLAALLTFIRQEWGNIGARVSPEDVRAIMAEEAARNIPYSAEELQKLPVVR